ncbi:tripartite motif-containing protein 45-like [Mya arenaria]|uniref:tripartite motif-containing protein 45-like n=1 Tax=Mya arenaria TaxID=6604 RepID=UPI0022E7E8B5|nr:tripartite motif-containing protein 45-like [Mya arenaria]
MATGEIDDNIEECGSDAAGGRIGSKCEPCRHRDRSEVASLFCKTCNIYMCDDCCDVHKVHMKNVDRHQIVAALDACVNSNVDMRGLDQCCEHKRAFMFYCEDHSDLCCEICAIAHHRKCDDVHEIAKVAKNVKDDERDNIRESIATASDVILKCKKDQMNNVSRVEEIVKEIAIYKEDLLTKIEKAKARIVSEMANHNTQEDERLNSRRNAAENLKKELDTHLTMSDSVRENGTETEIFILNHILKRTQYKAAQTLNTLLKIDYTALVGLKIIENI